MRIKQVIFSDGRSGNYNKDFAALRLNPKANGAFYDAKPVTAGFRRITQPGQCVSVILILDSGAMALGDCVDVILAGVSGRFPPFDRTAHFTDFEADIRSFLIGRDVASFIDVCAEWTDRAAQLNLHTAIRYGVSQALLQASSFARSKLMCEVIQEDYGFGNEIVPIPLLIFCQRDDRLQIDRAIMKRADLFPHASFPDVKEHVGQSGEKLLAYIQNVARRISEVGDRDYAPTIHVDVYGSLGNAFPDPVQLADYVIRLGEAAAPFKLMVESPIIAPSQHEQIEQFAGLRENLKKAGNAPKIIVDEWCNTLDDVRLFADHAAADIIHIKMPDMGSIHQTIEGAAYCRDKGVGFALGGSANETDIAARASAHVGLASAPIFMIGKPGLGMDEGLMIVGNEQARALALLGARDRGRR